MKRVTISVFALLALISHAPQVRAEDKSTSRRPPAGFPAADEARRLYDDADLNRAVQMYRFFYPTVSGAAVLKAGEESGVVDNKVFTIIDSKPRHTGFTYNSDTPYCFAQLDLSGGPFVVEMPAGPLIVVAMDVNQRWIGDMGIPGPDEGKGDKHLIKPPGYKGDVPQGYFPAIPRPITCASVCARCR